MNNYNWPIIFENIIHACPDCNVTSLCKEQIINSLKLDKWRKKVQSATNDLAIYASLYNMQDYENRGITIDSVTECGHKFTFLVLKNNKSSYLKIKNHLTNAEEQPLYLHFELYLHFKLGLVCLIKSVDAFNTRCLNNSDVISNLQKIETVSSVCKNNSIEEKIKHCLEADIGIRAISYKLNVSCEFVINTMYKINLIDSVVRTNLLNAISKKVA